jgi:hypothetical protein
VGIDSKLVLVQAVDGGIGFLGIASALMSVYGRTFVSTRLRECST